MTFYRGLNGFDSSRRRLEMAGGSPFRSRFGQKEGRSTLDRCPFPQDTDRCSSIQSRISPLGERGPSYSVRRDPNTLRGGLSRPWGYPRSSRGEVKGRWDGSCDLRGEEPGPIHEPIPVRGEELVRLDEYSVPIPGAGTVRVAFDAERDAVLDSDHYSGVSEPAFFRLVLEEDVARGGLGGEDPALFGPIAQVSTTSGEWEGPVGAAGQGVIEGPVAYIGDEGTAPGVAGLECHPPEESLHLLAVVVSAVLPYSDVLEGAGQKERYDMV